MELGEWHAQLIQGLFDGVHHRLRPADKVLVAGSVLWQVSPQNVGILKRHLSEDRSRHEHFICGPEPMMNAVEKTLNQLGVPFAKFHSERFNLV